MDNSAVSKCTFSVFFRAIHFFTVFFRAIHFSIGENYICLKICSSKAVSIFVLFSFSRRFLSDFAISIKCPLLSYVVFPPKPEILTSIGVANCGMRGRRKSLYFTSSRGDWLNANSRRH